MSKKKVATIPAPVTVAPAVATAPTIEMAVITLSKAEAVGIITTMLKLFLDPPENFQPQITFPMVRVRKVIAQV